MEHKFDEFFPLSNPEKYMCHVHRYQRGLSLLDIEINHIELNKRFYLVFIETRHFSGNMGWKGADFIIKPPLDTHEYLKQTKLDIRSEAIGLGAIKLYTVQNIDMTVQIVAGNAYIVDELTELNP